MRHLVNKRIREWYVAEQRTSRGIGAQTCRDAADRDALAGAASALVGKIDARHLLHDLIDALHALALEILAGQHIDRASDLAHRLGALGRSDAEFFELRRTLPVRSEDHTYELQHLM